MNWKDETSYSQSEKERIPRTWSVKLADMRLVVTRSHGLEGWFVDSAITGRRQLKSEEVAPAQIEALKMVRAIVNAIASEIHIPSESA